MKRGVLLVLLVAACGDKGVQPPRAATADSADQILDTMHTFVMRNGRRISDVAADTAWIYQLRQIADLKKVTVTFFDSAGNPVSTVTSNVGTYDIREHNLDARGNVVVVTPTGRTLHTEHLVYDQSRNLITCDTFFTWSAPGQGGGTGKSCQSDIAFKNITVTQPKAQQKGKGILLPGGAP